MVETYNFSHIHGVPLEPWKTGGYCSLGQNNTKKSYEGVPENRSLGDTAENRFV